MEWCGACWISSAMKPKRMCLASTPATKLQVCPYEGIGSEIKMTSKTTKSVIFVQHRNEYWSSIGPPNFWFLPRKEVFADLNPQNLRCTLARRKSEAWQQIQRHHVFAFHSFSLTILGEASPENRMSTQNSQGWQWSIDCTSSWKAHSHPLVSIVWFATMEIQNQPSLPQKSPRTKR